MIRGQRFELDLGSDDDEINKSASTAVPAAFVGDIIERTPANAKPPTAPTLKSRNGFPEHKRRALPSRPKPQMGTVHKDGSADGQSQVSATPPNSWQDEKSRIDQENRDRLAAMSPEEIEEERQDLMNSLSPAFIQRLMQRTNKNSGEQMQRILQQTHIDSGSHESNLALDPSDILSASQNISNASEHETKTDRQKSVKFSTSTQQDVTDSPSTSTPPIQQSLLPHGSIHFPVAPQPPSLDPASDTFLEDLHEKYFPSLPADPDKLEWMQTSTSVTNPYDPDATALSPDQIRFSFKGELIPPRTAAEIPVTAGLHHHGDAPDSAGYTIPELAHLSRSTYPAQRCIAFQTLGRLLYRLGKGEFGNAGAPSAVSEEEDSLSELAKELWGVVEREKIIELLIRESEGLGVDKGRHLSAKSYATEAVWLWQKGGGRRWKAS